jgi:glycosyltransferase involved in cell wall biosynthesis
MADVDGDIEMISQSEPQLQVRARAKTTNASDTTGVSDELTLPISPPEHRVLITHQGCIPIYRKSLFEQLARKRDIEYVVAYGDPPEGTHYIVARPPYRMPTLRTVNRSILVAGKPLIWQPIVAHFWRHFDAAILGDEIKYLSHIAIVIVAKVLRRPIVLWGFGYQPQYVIDRSRRGLGRLLARLGAMTRALLVKTVDGYLAYSDAGASELVKKGIPADRIAVLHNTVDIEFQRQLRDEIAAEPIAATRIALGVEIDAIVLLYFGRLVPLKRVDLLIDYARRARQHNRKVSAIIYGDGPELEVLKRQASNLSFIKFRSDDDQYLARALRVASAVVIPGFVGLAITHAFAHGVPMITREGNHPPEIAYLDHGRNGLILPKEPADFFEGIDKYLSDPAVQERLQREADRTADGLTTDTMASAIDGLIRRLLSNTRNNGKDSSVERSQITAGKAER